MPYTRTLAVTWPLVALSDGMSWEGTHRTSRCSKYIKMYKFYQLAILLHCDTFESLFYPTNLFRKDWNPKATVPPVTNATVIVVEVRPPDSRAPPCPLFRWPHFQGWHRHIYRTWWLQHQFWTEAIVEPRTWQSCKDVFFSHRCFFSFATFEVSTWFFTWRTLEKPDQSLFPALKKCFVVLPCFFWPVIFLNKGMVVRQPPVLLLDECTSALDPVTQEATQKTILKDFPRSWWRLGKHST